MKLSKTKKIILLGTSLAILTTSIVIPIVILNKDESDKENDIEKIFKILKAKTNEEKIIQLSNNANGKIIANNQDKIIEKIKILIGKANLKDLKIEILMEKDTNISIASQKIIIKLTKNQISKEIKDFSVKKQSVIDVNKDITAIKKVLDSKSGNDLIIILPSSSIGNIIEKLANKNAIIKKLRILVDPSNTSGIANHPSLKGTTIEVSMNVDKTISTISQNIIVSISKIGGTTLRTAKTFQAKRDFTDDEDMRAIKKILDAKTSNDLIITLPSDSTGTILDNENAIVKKLRILVNPLNNTGEANHSSLRGSNLTIFGPNIYNLISTTPQYVDIYISKISGSVFTIKNKFQVKKVKQ